MDPLQTSLSAINGVLGTLMSGAGPLQAEPPVRQATHQSLLDTSGDMLTFQAITPQLSVGLWLHAGWLAACSQAMLGMPMEPGEEGADDLMREMLAQVYGSVQSANADLKLPELRFDTVTDPRDVHLPETTDLVHFSLESGGETLAGLLLFDAPTARQTREQAEKKPKPDVEVARPDFPEVGGDSFDAGPTVGGKFNMLVDVDLEVVVELGRRKLPLADVLRLTTGSVVELEKLMGEPLDIYANGKLIAEGEAVVIDEQFGVRVTSIVNKRRRDKVFI
jgi:flagellar motor switch protein FliN/FliY